MADQITLYHNATSPYARKVLAQLIESGLADRVKVVDTHGSPLDPGTMPLAQNPLGKIPTLVTAEGLALFDSRVISRWIEAESQAGLYPSDESLWQVLRLESMAEGIMDAALLIVLEARLRPEALQFAPWVEGQWQKIERTLDLLEAECDALQTAALNMGQIALVCALNYLDLRHGARIWRSTRPRLAAWESVFSTRDALQATRAKG